MKLNAYIDHTALKPNMVKSDIEQLCAEAREHAFAAVCVPPAWVVLAKNLLQNTTVKICTVAGFPFGYTTVNAKGAEALDAIRNGAQEIDFVVNISQIKSGDWDYVNEEVGKLTKLVQAEGQIVKMIVETAYLTKDELERVCRVCAANKVDFVKTSTGFAESGANLDDVKLMRKVLPETVKIKASGGIKTGQQARAFVEAGADRIGTSSGPALLKTT